MSSEIFNRIKNIIASFAFPTKDQSLKRRGSDDICHPSKRKYSRVSDVFPGIIVTPREDLSTHQRITDPIINMTERRRSSHRTNNSNPHPLNQNNNYADLEYSDDEDDLVFKNPRNFPVFNNTASSMNSFRKNSSSILSDQHIPVIVHNTKSTKSLSNSVDMVHRTIVNGDIAEIPALRALTNHSRDLSATKSESWHKRFTAKLPSSKPVPPLIDAKTWKITLDSAGDFGSVRSHVNGIDISKETKLTNGIATADSFSRVSSISQKQSLQSSISQKKGNNTSAQNSFYANDRMQYLNLLQKIVPRLYKSNDTNRDQERLAQLAEARGSTKKNRKSIAAKLNGEDEVTEFIDLSDDDMQMISECRNIQTGTRVERKNEKQLPTVAPVNSFKDRLDLTPALQDNWIDNLSNRFKGKRQQQRKQIDEAVEDARQLSQNTERQEKLLRDKLRNCMVLRETVILEEEEAEEEEEFPEFTEEQHTLLKRALYRGSPDEVLVSKFNMNITRRDIYTLVGDTWLNDEVINFYMNLLMDRSEQRSSEGLPRVYSMNTFFVPRLLQSGQSGVRRWTRKVDIFSYDVIPVPVHVGQVHWCMAIINLKEKTIKYYDSMGTPNPRLLNALEDYLKDESMDKRKKPFDTSSFRKESVADSPRQMNGSDCGVFSCMTAEYITRNRDITFSQQNMPYFRQKMILEIVQGKLVL